MISKALKQKAENTQLCFNKLSVMQFTLFKLNVLAVLRTEH